MWWQQANTGLRRALMSPVLVVCRFDYEWDLLTVSASRSCSWKRKRFNSLQCTVTFRGGLPVFKGMQLEGRHTGNAALLSVLRRAQSSSLFALDSLPFSFSSLLSFFFFRPHPTHSYCSEHSEAPIAWRRRSRHLFVREPSWHTNQAQRRDEALRILIKSRILNL